MLLDAERRIAELEAELIAKNARIAEQDARIEALVRQVAALTERVGRNSGNSNLPPSSDPPGAGGGKQGRRSKGKRRGGQAGHRGSRRALLAAERVDDVVDFFPAQCEQCCAALPETPDPRAKRYQFTELPAFEPHTTQFRRHGVDCPRCQCRTVAVYDPKKIPSSPFGPRLMSAVGLLTRVYHLSRRRAVQLLADLVGVRIARRGERGERGRGSRQ